MSKLTNLEASKNWATTDVANVLVISENKKNKSFQWVEFFSKESGLTVISDNITAQFEKEENEVFLSFQKITQRVKEKKFSLPAPWYLTVISLPKQELDLGYSLTTHELLATIPQGTIIKPYQLQYFLTIKSDDELLAAKPEFRVHYLYQSLNRVISDPKSNITAVLDEISRLYISNAQKQDETAQIFRSVKSYRQLDLFSLYQLLHSQKFSALADSILTQCILNIIAFSPAFYQKLPLFKENYKNGVTKYLGAVFPEVIKELIFQYQSIDEIENIFSLTG